MASSTLFLLKSLLCLMYSKAKSLKTLYTSDFKSYVKCLFEASVNKLVIDYIFN